MTTKQRTTTSFKSTRKTAKQTTVEPPDTQCWRIGHDERKTDNDDAKPMTKNTKNNCFIHRYTPERRPDTTQTRKNPHKMGKLDSNQKWNTTYGKPKQNHKEVKK